MTWGSANNVKNDVLTFRIKLGNKFQQKAKRNRRLVQDALPSVNRLSRLNTSRFLKRPTIYDFIDDKNKEKLMKKFSKLS